MEDAVNLIEQEKREKTGRLDLSRCGLSEVPTSISELEWLRELILSNRLWLFEERKWLKGQNIGTRNRICRLSDSFLNLKNLERLSLSGDMGMEWRILDVHNLKYLEKLLFLELSNNIIPDYSFFRSLTNLKYLDLSGNEIEDVSFLEHCTNLETLILSGNRISSIDVIRDLPKLRTVYLNNNQIEDFSPIYSLIKKGIEVEWKNNYGTNSIVICDNPWTNPPDEIIKQGTTAILRYLKLQKEVLFSNLLEAKLIVLGDGLVGKTSLVNKILSRDSALPSVDNRTVGLEIKEWYPFDSEAENAHKGFKFNIWDFGGQGKYRDIQQFYCSSRSLYIYVTAVDDPTLESIIDSTEPYFGFDYWLSFITKYGHFNDAVGTDLKSPIIYVLNKSDLGKARINEVEIENKYLNIDFHKISCLQIDEPKFRRKFDDLIHEIRNAVQDISFDTFKQTYPSSWLRVKMILEEKRRTGINYISLDEYESIAKDNGLTTRKDNFENRDFSDSTIWRKVLDEIGTIIYFSDILPLSSRVIINPNWLKEGIQAALDYDKAIHQKGQFRREDFEGIWKDFEHSDYVMFISLMKKFEICYEIDQVYHIPALFPIEPKGLSDNNGFRIYQVEFEDFMPAGIIWRLIVKKSDYLLSNNVWKMGCLLEKQNTIIEIKENWSDRYIRISLKGENVKQLRDEIFEDVFSIVKSIEAEKRLAFPRVHKKAVCTCSQCKSSRTPTTYNLGVKQSRCMKSGELVIFEKIILEISDNLKIDEFNNLIIQDVEGQKVSFHIKNTSAFTQIFSQISRKNSLEHRQLQNILNKVFRIVETSGENIAEILKKIEKLKEYSKESYVMYGQLLGSSKELENIVSQLSTDQAEKINIVLERIEQLDETVFESSWDVSSLEAEINTFLQNIDSPQFQDEDMRVIKSELQRSDIALKHKLKFIIPLLFVKYEGEIELSSKQTLPRKLDELWRLLFRND